jgi:glutathione S-transferase
MILIGMYDSPFVRRVAVSLKLLGFEFEHRSWSVGKDFDRIREYNPLGRVPTLVLDDGTALLESAAILDYVDELATAVADGADCALLPRRGPDRRRALQLMAFATGAAEKGILQLYERAFRPEEKWHEPWLERCRTQMHAGLAALEAACAARGAGAWLVGDRLGQADITATCVFTFLSQALQLTPQGVSPEAAPYPALGALAARCEALPPFQQTRMAFFSPGSRG